METKAYELFTMCKSQNIHPSRALAKVSQDPSIDDDNLLPGQLNIIRKYVYFGYRPTSYMTPTEQDQFEEWAERRDYLTCFNFLAAHNGLRKGCIHVLLGYPGQGKSSLIRSIALENSINHNVFILLSEEATTPYSLKINQTASMITHLKKINEESLSKIKFATEIVQDFDPKNNFEDFFQMIKDFLIKDKIGLFIYDNFSTGLLSEEFDRQKLAIKRFKEIASELDIPILIAIHPTKSARFQNAYLTNEQVRGNIALATMPEYLYTMNTCEVNGVKKTYIYIDKARYFDRARDSWFELKYEVKDKKGGFYAGDSPVRKEIAIENLKKNRK
jgi:archaellum biogenesis ATPase FlaH